MSNQGTCNRCQRPVFWFRSKAGKNYRCNSDNYRDFHNCSQQQQPTGENVATLDRIQLLENRIATFEDRISILEAAVGQEIEEGY